MQWAWTYFAGFVIVIAGVFAALWKMGLLQNVDPTWVVIGISILVGVGLMLSITRSGVKENIQIDRK
jgi:hypothetical protein